MATAWVLEQLGPAARTQRSAKAVPGGLVPTSSRLASLDQMLEPSSLVEVKFHFHRAGSFQSGIKIATYHRGSRALTPEPGSAKYAYSSLALHDACQRQVDPFSGVLVASGVEQAGILFLFGGRAVLSWKPGRTR
jgi:hypothetical protein